MTNTVTLPTININGSDANALARANMSAMESIEDAINALSEAAPHGRDYQTAPAGAYQKAQSEHNERMKALRSMHNQLEAIVMHCIEVA